MLAATIKDVDLLNYPLFASPKLDGIRCVMLDGKAVTRNLKPIPNNFIRKFLEANHLLDGFDGEIMIKSGDFNSVQSAVMSEDGEPNFYYAVFDSHKDNNLQYSLRLDNLSATIKTINDLRIREVQQFIVSNKAELLELEKEVLEDGYEGLILRNASTTYKYGRSTLNEAKLLKLKRFEDDEATVLNVEPLYENNNTATTNKLGRTERSSHKQNMVAQPTAGSLLVVLDSGKEFSIGTGMDDATRQDIWDKRTQLIGKKVKFKYQELSADGIPRFPVYIGFRNPADL